MPTLACRTTSRRRFVWWKRPRPKGRSRNQKYSPCCSVWTCCNARKIGLLFGHLALCIWTIAEISPSERSCFASCQPLLLLVAICWAAGATNKANTLYLNDHHLLCRGTEGRFLIKQPSLGVTVPTMDLVSDIDPIFRGDILDPEQAPSFFETNGEPKSTRSDLSSILYESGSDERPSKTIDPALPAEGELVEDTSQSRRTPLLMPRSKALSDEEHGPGRSRFSSDSNHDAQKALRGRGYRRGVPTSPRKGRDE